MLKKVTTKQKEELCKKLGVTMEQVNSAVKYIKDNQDDFLQPGMKGFYQKWGRKMNAQARRKKPEHPIVQKMIDKDNYKKAKKIEIDDKR